MAKRGPTYRWRAGDYSVRRMRALSGGEWVALDPREAELTALRETQAQQLAALRTHAIRSGSLDSAPLGSPEAAALLRAATRDLPTAREKKAARFVAVREGKRIARPGKREREAARRRAVTVADLCAPLRDGPDKMYSVVSGFAPPIAKTNPADKEPEHSRGLFRPLGERRAVKLGLLPRKVK